MANILIVYGTAYGQTARVADRICGDLSRAGHRVEVIDAGRLPPRLTLSSYDAFVIAAPVLFSRHLPAVRRFVRRHLDRLNAAPAAFVSLSGTAGNPSPEGQRAAAQYVEQFLRRTGWKPQRTASFAGAMAFTKYNFILRPILRRISGQNGGPTDTSRDYEFTDWGAVDRFATELAALFATADHAGTPQAAPATGA